MILCLKFKNDITEEDFLHIHILPKDDTVLRFSQETSTYIHTDHFKSFVTNLIPAYVDEYSVKSERKNDKYLISTFKSEISNQSATNKFYKDTIIEANNIKLKLEYSWKNGSTNLVKPLSFDLTDSIHIENKALHTVGTLNIFSDLAYSENYRFDFLVAPPSNKRLFKNYDNALAIIDNVKVPKKIIQENQISEYTLSAIDQM